MSSTVKAGKTSRLSRDQVRDLLSRYATAKRQVDIAAEQAKQRLKENKKTVTSTGKTLLQHMCDDGIEKYKLPDEYGFIKLNVTTPIPKMSAVVYDSVTAAMDGFVAPDRQDAFMEQIDVELAKHAKNKSTLKHINDSKN